jgi:hypothetical protein
LFVSFISNEPAVSTKNTRSKLSSSTPLPNHRPHGNLIQFQLIKWRLSNQKKTIETIRQLIMNKNMINMPSWH